MAHKADQFIGFTDDHGVFIEADEARPGWFTISYVPDDIEAPCKLEVVKGYYKALFEAKLHLDKHGGSVLI